MYTVKIDRLGAGADAVGKLENGKTVFVPFGCPGDECTIELVDEKERFANGRIVEITSPSPLRRDAQCSYFMVCGGCDWQHIDPAVQAQTKRTMVVDALTRIGKIARAERLVTDTLIPGPEYGYRNKIELVCKTTESGFDLGFLKRGSNELVSIDSCPLASKRIKKFPKAIRGALRYLQGSQDFNIERIGIRAALHSTDVEIALYTPPGAFPRGLVAKVLKQACPEAKSIVRVLLKDKNGVRKVSGVEVLAGPGFWRESIGEYEYMISAPSFFQVNTRGAEALVDLVVEWLNPDGSDTVVDLYSGAGTFTIPLALRAGDALAIESSGPAVKDLRRNLESNNAWAEAIGGDAAREILDLEHYDLAVVDPPRAGLDDKVVQALIQNGPERLAYVSCDPATLARDLAKLSAGAFTINRIVPVDMFPNTHHVETVALMTRVKSRI